MGYIEDSEDKFEKMFLIFVSLIVLLAIVVVILLFVSTAKAETEIIYDNFTLPWGNPA